MKIAKLLSMAPVLAACLALAAVSAAQIGCCRSDKTGLGMVSLRVDRKDIRKVEVSLEKNGVLKLDCNKVEQLRLEGDDVYRPGNPSDRREIKIGEKGQIRVGEKNATTLYFPSYGRKWDADGRCYCPDPPIPPTPPWPWPWPPKMEKLGKVSLLVDGKNKQKLIVFLGINGALKLGDKRVEKLRLGDGRELRLGESSDLSAIAIGRTGEIQIGGVLVTSLHYDGNSVEWDLGAKSYRLSPAPPKSPTPPRE